MEQLWTQISRADVTLAAERTDCDGVFVQDWKVVAEASIHVPDAVETRREHAGEYWYEAWR